MSNLSLQTFDRNPEPGSVRAVFSLDNDRWSHVIQLRLLNDETDVGEDKIVTIASSVEGSSVDDWPVSPALQELAEHEIGPDRVLLGVGMAGGSHWSISASVIDSQKLLLDSACLAHQSSIGWIGSTYQIADDVQIDGISDTEVRLIADGMPITFTAVSEEEWGGRVSVVGQRITVTPTRVSEIPSQSTRWAFCIG